MKWLNKITRKYNVGKLYALAIEIMGIYNLRFAELQSINKINFLPNTFQIVKGKKGSSDIVIRDREILKKLDDAFRTYGAEPFKLFTYKQFYGFIWRNYAPIILKIQKRKNFKVTHLFRYLAVANISDPQSVKAILHHNSIKSGKYYINKIRS